MASTAHHDDRIAAMTFASVYPHYVAKVERKGRSEAELMAVITWLTALSETEVMRHLEGRSTFAELFTAAPMAEGAHLITGVICGYRVEEIENALTQKVRWLDKVVDELARGKAIEKICRQPH